MENIVKYLSSDQALYESHDEVLYVEHVFAFFDTGINVMSVKSDGNGNLTLSFATPNSYYKQNSKKSYGLYEIKCGITNAPDIRRYMKPTDYFYEKISKYKPENKSYDTRSVGIDWDKVKSVSGKTYSVQYLIKSKGFMWDRNQKKWIKSVTE